MPTIADRAAGTILGGAIGDAWGGRFEGDSQAGAVTVPDRMFVSDDTQLTLATCESLIERHSVDPENIAARFAAWHRARRVTGMGASTLKALQELEAGGHWALSGARGERAAGNGAAMRVAPLAFLINPSEMSDRRILRDVCRITHQHEEAYVGGLAVVTAIHLLALEYCSSPEDLLSLVAGRLPDSRVRDRLLELATMRADEIPARLAQCSADTGYVAETVPLAILAVELAARVSFEEMIRNVIAGGGDTDTRASIAGQIAGAWVGASRLPQLLLERIDEIEAIERQARDFAEFVQRYQAGRGGDG